MFMTAEQVAPLPTGHILLCILCLLGQMGVDASFRQNSGIILPAIRIQRRKLILILIAVVLIIAS